MSLPLISAVVPFYNQGSFVGEAVRALLRQTWQNLEIIVVDDGSDKEESLALAAFAAEPRVIVLRQENAGVSVARNRGIAAAGGKYILTLDADDLCAESFAEKAASLLEADDNLGLVNAVTCHFGDRSGPAGRLECTVENILSWGSHTSLSMFRKADWALTSGFDPALKLAEDIDFWLSLLELGRRFQRIEEPLYYYRRHGESAQSRFKRLYGAMHGGGNAGVIRYVLDKHKELYAGYPGLAEKVLAQRGDRPKFAAFKKIKYRCILGLARLPLLRGPLRDQARKARYKSEIISHL